MILLNLEQVYLLRLIQYSLFDVVPEIPNDANWDELFEAAKSHCIVPLLLRGIATEHISEWQGLSYRYKAYYMQMLHAQNSLVDLLNENNISFVILKGTAAAIYYPTPTLRTFGDIDFYVSEENMDSVKSLLLNNGYIYITNDDRHFEFEKYGIDFELHSKFSCNRYNDIDHILINGLNKPVEYKINNSSFPGLPTYENGLVILGHIMQHMKSTGIGLRHIIDWMMFVHKELDDSAWEDGFKPLAIEAGLEKLAITVTYMCRKWIGLPNKITWCNEADEDLADQLLVRILDDGNFGNDRAPNEKVKKSLRKEGTFKYLQRSGIENWPLAKKYAVFRPIAWLYQLCRYACMGILGLFTGKKVFMKNKPDLSLEELLKRLE